jgi:diguanylate cyclase
MVRTILVIEDETMLRENLMSLLTHEGFAVVGAANGREGVQQAKQVQPLLILCDVTMPVLDGYGVLQELRQDPSTAAIPFIFLSGQAEYRQIRQGMNLGADDYLTKPLVRSELVEAVRSRLQKQQILQASQAARIALSLAEEDLQGDRARTVTLPKLDGWSTLALEAGKLAWEGKSWESLLPSIQRDNLTGLPNRHAFMQVLKVMLERARQYDQRVVLLSLNVLRFGSINTAFGYATGDRLLQALATRLMDCVNGHGLVARSNGDEFLIGLDELFWEEDGETWAAAIRQACSEPFTIDQQPIVIQISLGGAACAAGQSQPEQLLLQSDMARRACEEGGKLPYVFHDRPSTDRAVEQRLLETELNRAILQHEFQVYYQPQVTLPTGQITGAEALLRWRHPQRGMVAPDQFIAIAEDLGLIVPIGEWVLRTACMQAKLWDAVSPVPLKMSVNLSMRQLQQENLAEQVTRILQVTELHPRQLTLELTETTLLADMETAIQTLSSLRQLGVQIAIDDFGKGYSSLHYLSHLPIDVLKIDQSFVQHIPTDHNAVAIVNAIITMAHELQIHTVAEGVETIEQARFLQQHGCHTWQGHLYSTALPQPEFERLLQQPGFPPIA